MEVKKISSNYHRFNIAVEATDTKWLFTCSDVHFDNPKCRRDLFLRDLDRAMDLEAYIVITGDLLCLMQGAFDPRKNKSAIRPEHNHDNYLDLVINDTAEKLLPYAKNILMISQGNHETSVSRRSETDVMTRLVERINLMAGTNIQIGNYRGYYTLNFNYRSGASHPLHVGYSHGNWGGVITKGVLSVVRNAAVMPDCDIMFSGHTHDAWIVTQPRWRRFQHKVSIENQWHVKTGTYKEEFEEGKGWAVERIGMPKHIGGALTRIDYNSRNGLSFEITLTTQ